MSDANSQYAAPVPRAVREQAERAEQLGRDLGMANVPGGDDETSEGGAQPPQDDGQDNDSSYRSSEPQEGGGGTPPPPPEPDRREADWEQRYRTLQGKYDSEMGQMRGQLMSMQTLIATMQSAPPPERAPAPPPRSAEPIITPEDRDMWGDELPEAVNRWVGHTQEERFQRLEAQLDQLRGGQQRQDVTLTQHSVQSQLDMDPELSGRWRQLNDDPRFLQWVGETDPFSGQPRVVLLRDAYARGDAYRTGHFFKSYLVEHTAPPAPRPTPHTGQNGSSVATAGRMRLGDLAAPGRAAATGTNSGASPEKRIWTNREIGAFYRDVQKGLYRGREVDQARTEQEISTAASEGRVTQ